MPALAASGGLDAACAEIERLAAHPRVRVVGETGLDYYRTGPEGVPAQQDSFRRHIDLAKRLDKALQVHDRDSHDDVLRVLAEEGAPDRTVLHCFSGGPDMARECVERGYHLSFSGTVTFKSAKALRDALAVTPLELLLVETDAPYLTPAPVARRDQQPGPRAAHRPGDGGGPRGRGADPLPGAQRERGAPLRPLVMPRGPCVTHVSVTGGAGVTGGVQWDAHPEDTPLPKFDLGRRRSCTVEGMAGAGSPRTTRVTPAPPQPPEGSGLTQAPRPRAAGRPDG